jgi:hypothetical protein
MLSSRFAGIPISSSTIDGPGVPQLPAAGSVTWRAVTGSGGRNPIGTATDIKGRIDSEFTLLQEHRRSSIEKGAIQTGF